MNKFIIIKTTVKNKTSRNNIINKLIKNNYVSCINIIEDIFSCYKWKDELKKEKEDILLIKTMKRNEKIVYEVIKDMHDYEIPEISSISIRNVEENYLNWTNQTVISKRYD